jgi:hypothetical protein
VQDSISSRDIKTVCIGMPPPSHAAKTRKDPELLNRYIAIVYRAPHGGAELPIHYFLAEVGGQVQAFADSLRKVAPLVTVVESDEFREHSSMELKAKEASTRRDVQGDIRAEMRRMREEEEEKERERKEMLEQRIDDGMQAMKAVHASLNSAPGASEKAAYQKSNVPMSTRSLSAPQLMLSDEGKLEPLEVVKEDGRARGQAPQSALHQRLLSQIKQLISKNRKDMLSSRHAQQKLALDQSHISTPLHLKLLALREKAGFSRIEDLEAALELATDFAQRG